MNETIRSIFNELNIDNTNGLATDENFDLLNTYQRLFYKQAKDKIGVNAVYFLRDSDGIAKIPLIYFSILDTQQNLDAAARLHSLSWNMGAAPLLFVVTPTELKIYNNYKTPRRVDGRLDPRAGLIETISLIADLETQRKKLRPYNRTLLESGDYWRRSKERFDINTRIDTTLMKNLKVMRSRLITKIKSRLSAEQAESINIISIVHALISRSILIKYLEERKDSNGDSVFPKDFYKQFCNRNLSCAQYTDVLEDKEATYRLFAVLEKKFNGDMLPLIDNEYDLINEEDLKELRLFLVGDSDLEHHQLSLWPLYDFNIIPIQIISSIYELFFHLSDTSDDDKGTYYTPLHLVETLLDEVYPWEGEYEPTTIIDPSCGSGIFLVEAYRRIVCRWMQTNKMTRINNSQLTELIKENIYGVDINEEAVRVASFSLSLALCDFLDPRNIWDDLSLPKLMGENLIVSDFFDETELFSREKYDIVIGNPPWKSQLTDLSIEYLKKNKKVVGDNQIAQAFSIKSSSICKDTGIVCLLMPSKGFLFNRSAKSSKYRRAFFSDNTVSVIINFSIYRKFLFDHASGPCTAVIYSPAKPKGNNTIFYCTPKPQFTVQDTKKFSIDPTDICKIPSDIVHDDRIWKIAMWGSPRDLELIDRIQSTYPTLTEFMKSNGMSSAEGFKRGNRKDVFDNLTELPVVDVKEFCPFYFGEESLEINTDNTFERVSSKNLSIFRTPHLIIKQSHRKARFYAAVLDYDAIFNHSFLGISGDELLLKYLCLIINSKLFSYYHLLTSRAWMVERDLLEAGDIRTIPIPIPNKQALQKATEIFETMLESENEKLINEFVYDIYKLRPYEIYLVNDAIDYIYNYFDRKSKSVVFNEPSNKMYSLYYETLIDVLKNSLGSTLRYEGFFYVGDSPLSVLMLSIENKSGKLHFINSEEETARLLIELDSMLIENRHNIFIRRNVRIYGEDVIYIVKPKQKKYWTFSSACRDADEIFADVMKAWR